MFSKLNLWSLDVDKAVYVDANTVVLQSLEDYFEYPGPFYGERSPSHKGINAGILVVEPKKTTLDNMLEYAFASEPMQFFWPRNQVGCTEQELFNQYWIMGKGDVAKASPHHFIGEGAKINNTRHADHLSSRFLKGEGRKDMKENGARIVHWVTTKCKKPWAVKVSELKGVGVDPHAVIRHLCDPEMYLLWHSYYWSLRPAHDDGIDSHAAANELPRGLQKK